MSYLVYKKSIFESNSKSETHGDMLLDFVNKSGFKGKVYYYEAVNSEGIITTDEIIQGLEWLSLNNITKVNISLSTKKYSDKLDSWITNHPEMKIYCSYNNKLNTTTDYPAMYDNAIGCSSDSKINYKHNDCQFRNNKLIVINKGIYFYEGNSYLSLWKTIN